MQKIDIEKAKELKEKKEKILDIIDYDAAVPRVNGNKMVKSVLFWMKDETFAKRVKKIASSIAEKLDKEIDAL